MIWSEQPIEKQLQELLKSLPQPRGAELFADYTVARRFVIEQIAGYISSFEPDLTDHSASHIVDVLNRVYQLIGNEQHYFKPHEFYLLMIAVLFHDTGNLHGRKEHHKKIATVYDALRKRDPRFATERNAVLAIAGAHTGSAKDGSKDTLGELDRLSFSANSVRANEIAAVLRFADELAEGPHRTSAYLQNHAMYKPESKLFHKYASVTEYCIERGDERIAITYSLDLEYANGTIWIGNTILLKDFLEYSYSRITKLDQERRYCKHYCDLLSVFKITGAWFQFYYDGQQLDIDIEPIVISDLIVPGDHTKSIVEIDPNYEIAKLVAALEKACKG